MSDAAVGPEAAAPEQAQNAETASEGPGEPLFEAADAESASLGAAGLKAGNIMGSFIHLIDSEQG